MKRGNNHTIKNDEMQRKEQIWEKRMMREGQRESHGLLDGNISNH